MEAGVCHALRSALRVSAILSVANRFARRQQTAGERSTVDVGIRRIVMAAPKSKPIVLAAQPEKFTLFDSAAKLREWEKFAVEKFGLKSSIAKGITGAVAQNGGSCCESGRTDDCDVD
jgi:hypothetical protein